jgi:hypothetical protein
MRLLKLSLKLLFNTFDFYKHFSMFPGFVENSKNAYVPSNVHGELLDGHGTPGVIKLDKHVSFLVLRDFDGVVFVTSILVNEETKFFVNNLTFNISVDVSGDQLLQSNFIIVEGIVLGRIITFQFFINNSLDLR